MLIPILTLVLMPILTFLELAVQRWLFRNSISSGMTSRGRQIDTLTPYDEPCATIDPGSPPSQVSDGRIGSIIEDGGNGTNMDNIQGLVFVVIEANIEIGVRPL